MPTQGGDAAFQPPHPRAEGKIWSQKIWSQVKDPALGDDFVTAVVVGPPPVTRHSIRGEDELWSTNFSENRQPPSDRVRGQAFPDHALGRQVAQHILQD